MKAPRAYTWNPGIPAFRRRGWEAFCEFKTSLGQCGTISKAHQGWRGDTSVKAFLYEHESLNPDSQAHTHVWAHVCTLRHTELTSCIVENA